MANKTANSMINMRVTANSIQGHRKYMEDCYKIRFQRESSLYASKNKAILSAAKKAGFKLNPQANIDENSQSDILFSYFAIFDGHGGKEASQFAKERLYWKIVEMEDFWSNDDNKVLNAIKEGFFQCHLEMWDELSNWPKTPSGLPSTSGSTATVLFIRKNKAYVGHVGDSGLVIGYTKNSHSATSQLVSNIPWLAKKLTKDHKPEDPTELRRIESSGGSVMTKGGINRVVWNRPILNNNINNVKRNTMLNSTSMSNFNSYKSTEAPVQTERIPFLAVARSLGDLWSYDCNRDEFIVSPIPDVFQFDLDPRFHKCLILATDGLWNVMRPSECVDLVRQTDRETDELKQYESSTELQQSSAPQPFVNPSQRLNSVSLQRCCEKMIRADNTTCITIMLDQPVVDESDDDDYLNSDNTVIQAANITSLVPNNKTFDKTKKIDDSEYYHENLLNNDEDEDDNEKEEEDEEDDQEDEDDLSKYQENRRRKRQQTKQAFNQTTSTTIESEFNTPLNRRSRSLMSLRRRHWSASSNRSASNHNLTALNNVNSRNKFVNSENREQRRLFSNDDDQSTNTNYNTRSYNTRMNMNKSSSSQCISSATKPSSRLKACSNYPSAPNFNQTSKIRISRTVTRTTTTTFQIKQQQQQESKKSMNVSAISFKGLNRLSRNLRKSFNDIYTLNKTSDNKRRSRRVAESQPSQEDLDDSKENHNSPKAVETKSQSKSSPSKYAKRLRRFKNTILKSSLFGKKKSSRTTVKSKVDELNVSKSMPDLNKIDLCDEKEENPTCETTNMKTNQSFVNNVKSKLSNLKRNKYFNNETNIEAKRPKFY